MSHKSIKLAAAIVNRGAGNRAAAIFHTYNHEILLAVRGHGTASSAVMDCLGLDEPEKDLVLGLSSKADADRLLRALGREMEFSKPGHGIAFTLSLTGISFAAMDILSRHEDQTGPNSRPAEHKEDIPMTNSHSYELIASVIHTDLSLSLIHIYSAFLPGQLNQLIVVLHETGNNSIEAELVEAVFNVIYQLMAQLYHFFGRLHILVLVVHHQVPETVQET